MLAYVIVNVCIVAVLGLACLVFGKKPAPEAAGAKPAKAGYSTRNIVIIAIIAAIAGVVNTGVGNVWYLLNTSLGPLGGALLQGAFMWAYVLAAFLVRKPGAALLVGVIESAVEILLGNAAGIGTLGWGVSQGLAIEAVILICGYKKYGMLTALLAGAAASQFGTLWSSILYGWDPATAAPVWLAIPVNLVSGTVISGLLGYFLYKAIVRTKLIRSGQ
jgi:energy-coupling factor transport system substrate-specific component